MLRISKASLLVWLSWIQQVLKSDKMALISSTYFILGRYALVRFAADPLTNNNQSFIVDNYLSDSSTTTIGFRGD